MDPSIGRVVLVAFKIRGVLVERPAIITSTAVWNGTTIVNAFVFRESGDESSHGIEANMVCLPHTPDGTSPADGCWRWPPRVEPKSRKAAAPSAAESPAAEENS